jgi:hypothetical protein
MRRAPDAFAAAKAANDVPCCVVHRLGETD